MPQGVEKNQIEWILINSPKERFWAKLLPTIAISLFLVSLFFMICFIVFIVSTGNQELKSTLMPYIQVVADYFWLALIVLFALVTMAVSSFIKVFTTRIVLGDLGITIEANAAPKTYSWNEFEYFSDRADHLSLWPSGFLIPWFVKKVKNKMGKVLFYVQFKNSTRMNPYIILEVPRQLGEKVRDFLSGKLAEV